MEWLNTNILWWHWLAIGIVLVVAEIFVPSLVIIWFGLAAILVGILKAIIDLSFPACLFLWAGGSVIFLAIWFRFFKKTRRSYVGQAREYAHVLGTIEESLEGEEENGRYKAFFNVPVLGDRVWIVESDDPLEIGDSVKIRKVVGQILKVKKVN